MRDAVVVGGADFVKAAVMGTYVVVGTVSVVVVALAVVVLLTVVAVGSSVPVGIAVDIAAAIQVFVLFLQEVKHNKHQRTPPNQLL